VEVDTRKKRKEEKAEGEMEWWRGKSTLLCHDVRQVGRRKLSLESVHQRDVNVNVSDGDGKGRKKAKADSDLERRGQLTLEGFEGFEKVR
jgi:hypothetical protein